MHIICISPISSSYMHFVLFSWNAFSFSLLSHFLFHLIAHSMYGCGQKKSGKFFGIIFETKNNTFMNCGGLYSMSEKLRYVKSAPNKSGKQIYNIFYESFSNFFLPKVDQIFPRGFQYFFSVYGDLVFVIFCCFFSSPTV